MMTTSNEHNNAPAVPQGWPPFDELDDDLIDAACTAGSVLYRVDLMRAYECIRSAMLAATPAHAPAQEVPSDPNGWCQYVAGMVFCWLQMQEGLGLTSYDEDRFVEAIAGIIQRRLWAYKPAQEVGLTDELIKEAAGQPDGYKFSAKGISKIDVWPHGGNWFPLYSLAQVQAIVAALRAKGGKHA